MRVVHLLEMIQVNEHDRKFVVVALRAVNFRIQDESHVPRIVKRSAVILDRQLVDSLHVPRVFESNRREVRKRFQ